MPDLGDMQPRETRDISLIDPQVGQVLKLTFQSDPGDQQPELVIKPIDDMLVREIDRRVHEGPDGLLHHTVYFRIERVGI